MEPADKLQKELQGMLDEARRMFNTARDKRDRQDYWIEQFLGEINHIKRLAHRNGVTLS